MKKMKTETMKTYEHKNWLFMQALAYFNIIYEEEYISKRFNN